MQDREAWLAERRLGIGGSDIFSLFEGCARRLWFDKRNVPPDFPAEQTALMERGHELEDAAARMYARKTGRELIAREAMVSEDHRWARVNIDREIHAPDKDGPGVLEVKTVGQHEFRRIKEKGLRDSHIFQVQHGMLASTFRWGAYAVLWPDGWQMLHFDVDREDRLIRAIIERGEPFWRSVTHGPMPEPLDEIGRECKACPWRKQCRGEKLLAAAKVAKEDSAIACERDESFAELLVDYRQADAALDDAQALVDAIKNAIKEKAGDRVAIECEPGRFYFRHQVSNRVDSAGLKSKYPDVYADVLKPSTNRPLRVYLND